MWEFINIRNAILHWFLMELSYVHKSQSKNEDKWMRSFLELPYFLKNQPMNECNYMRFFWNCPIFSRVNVGLTCTVTASSLMSLSVLNAEELLHILLFIS